MDIIIVGVVYTNIHGKSRKVINKEKDWMKNDWFVEYSNDKNVVKRCSLQQFLRWKNQR